MGINTTPDKPINVSVLYEVEELPLRGKGGHIINTPHPKRSRIVSKRPKGA